MTVVNGQAWITGCKINDRLRPLLVLNTMVIISENPVICCPGFRDLSTSAHLGEKASRAFLIYLCLRPLLYAVSHLNAIRRTLTGRPEKWTWQNTIARGAYRLTLLLTPSVWLQILLSTAPQWPRQTAVFVVFDSEQAIRDYHPNVDTLGHSIVLVSLYTTTT